jgi:hypothetical protein
LFCAQIGREIGLRDIISIQPNYVTNNGNVEERSQGVPELVQEGTISEFLPVESYDSGNIVEMAVATQQR